MNNYVVDYETKLTTGKTFICVGVALATLLLNHWFGGADAGELVAWLLFAYSLVLSARATMVNCLRRRRFIDVNDDHVPTFAAVAAAVAFYSGLTDGNADFWSTVISGCVLLLATVAICRPRLLTPTTLTQLAAAIAVWFAVGHLTFAVPGFTTFLKTNTFTAAYMLTLLSKFVKVNDNILARLTAFTFAVAALVGTLLSVVDLLSTAFETLG